MKSSLVGTKPEPKAHNVTLLEAFWVWLKVALYSFGGPAGQIAVMHKLLVEEKRWVSENRFLHALNYCMLLPGPEAQQLATYIGWLLHRTRGGLIAGTLFVLPGFISILGLSVLYASFQETTFIQAIFFGLKAAVLAVVIEAVFKIGKRVLKNAVMVAIAALSFAAIFFFNVPFPLIVITAGLAGYSGGRFFPGKFYVIKGHAASAEDDDGIAVADASASHTKPSLAKALQTLLIWGSLWFIPLIILVATLGRGNVFVEAGLFFSQAAVVTFGGAYAVLAYIAQQAVETYGWLQPGEMLDGLGMAETTPGPLIQVVQFVGFMAAFRHAGEVNPVLAGVLGSVLVTWVTFVPCFLWIFLGAPYIEHLRGNKLLNSALSAITAAVVGVILNLALWFGLHVVFAVVNEAHVGALRLYVPVWQTLDFASLLISAGAFVAIFRSRLGLLPTLGLSALVGLAYHLLFRS